ncbi:MAG: helix-turn-helix transcriptional regulator [Bdellovibrionales bacterium]|nr:helix-turn-helix transcriptional regulator [Bdellovibrionales bacterium]MCB0412808.1 helix-turn-helix transcriptional regulator [Bdellovibrionales bacterium]
MAIKKAKKRGIAKGTVLVSPEERRKLVKLGKRIKEHRVERGWTLHQTEDNGFSNWTHWQYIESGKKNITFTTLVRIAKTLKIPLSELLKDI